MARRIESAPQAVTTTPIEELNGLVIDAAEAAPHAPELYAFDQLATPVATLDAITDADLERYQTQGYLAVEHAFDPATVAAAGAGLNDLVMGQYPDFKGIQFERGSRSKLATMTLNERHDAVRKLMWFTAVEPRLQALATDPALLAVLERLLADRPVLFQDMALLKPPRGREKPWHQDKAYFTYTSDTRVVGVWIAIDEATPANGCMRVRPGTHREGPVIHFQRRDWQICDTDGRQYEVVAVPLKPGGLLLFDGLIQHGTPYNPTAERRRAVQFHYAPKGASKTDDSERLAIFGSEGKDVEC